MVSSTGATGPKTSETQPVSQVSEGSALVRFFTFGVYGQPTNSTLQAAATESETTPSRLAFITNTKGWQWISNTAVGVRVGQLRDLIAGLLNATYEKVSDTWTRFSAWVSSFFAKKSA